MSDKPCKHCGHCPTCGHTPRPVVVYPQPYPVYPHGWWHQPYRVTWQSPNQCVQTINTTSSASGGNTISRSVMAGAA